ncbi:hypothetical protein B0H19DRAFT_1193290 [Mycena capillaripes]|nr:hypothetical protein B0H19DRAFT_1193290 [Mycena capillaripes]
MPHTYPPGPGPLHRSRGRRFEIVSILREAHLPVVSEAERPSRSIVHQVPYNPGLPPGIAPITTVYI